MIAWRVLQLVALLAAACAPIQTEDPPAVYVVTSPLCVVICFPQLGNVREDVNGGTGSVSLSQSGGALGLP